MLFCYRQPNGGFAMRRYLIVTMTLLLGMTARPVAAENEPDLRAGVVKIVSTFEGKHRTGTGFIVKTDGTSVFIVTAAHVVEGDPMPKIEFFTRQNTIVGAAVLKQDLRYDLALVKAELTQQLLVLKLERAAIAKLGDEVLTIGFPQGGGGWSISHADLAGREGADLILSGGAIDEGSSGGPLIKGSQVIGVVQGVQGKFARAMPTSVVVGMLEGWGIALESEPAKPASGDLQRATDALTGSIDYSNFEQAKKAAERGDSRAMYKLAEMYADGKVVPENFSEAAKWLRRSADAGYPDAHIGMGSISLIKAAGFARDDESAVHFASDESKSEEITSLISHPEKIQIGNQADLKDAVNWFRRGAEQGNDEKAQLILGTMLLTGVGVQKDLSQAARMFQLASTKMPAAQAILGQFYFEGTGVKQDFHEAARRLREAAEKGVDISFWMLGYLYMEGLGVVQDPAEAAKWFRKGLAQGDSAAKAYLGMLHFIGKGVPQDFSKAYKLAREAAEQGNQVGQYLIGMIFFSGKGVAQNSGESLKWMQAAARQGESHAQQFLRERGQNW
ncbi:MAG: hypothetical protein GDA65_03840 [Nitrospira sp. CR1.1]|nr:hypothetical protein [Nitrospira sp. CR1.1]